MRRIRDTFNETPNSVLTVGGAFLVLTLLILLPRIFPTERVGVECSRMANPIPGGNNGSHLTAQSEGLLSLQLTLAQSNISTIDALAPTVIFQNGGVGSVTIFLVPQEALLRDDGSQGLHFEIRRSPDGAVFAEPATIRPPVPVRQVFPVEGLHVLGARQSCRQDFSFDPARLSNLGLPPGNYVIQAIYRNPFSGQWNVAPQATATPIFPTQGVYVVNELRSNEIAFSIGLVQPLTGEAQPLGG